MLVFGHTGIILGTAALLAGAIVNHRFSKLAADKSSGSSIHNSPESSYLSDSASPKASWFASLGKYVDIRLLLVGALLPDIIDKPIGLYILREAFSNGRIFAHTLFFLILITVAGWFVYRLRRNTWFFVLSFGTFMHLALDQMWEMPQILLWPLFGLDFPRVDLTYLLPTVFQALFSDPKVYIPELIGAAVIVWFIWTPLRRRNFYLFLRYGQVD